MYKNPEELSKDLYNGTGNALYFIPVNVNQYLDMLNQSIPTYDQTYSFALTNTIVFDYTQLGGNDTIQYNYNEYGLMSHYQIFYNGSLAFSFELKSYSLGGFNPLLLTVIISLVSSAVLVPIYFVLRRRRSKSSKQKTRTKSLLKKVK